MVLSTSLSTRLASTVADRPCTWPMALDSVPQPKRCDGTAIASRTNGTPIRPASSTAGPRTTSRSYSSGVCTSRHVHSCLLTPAASTPTSAGSRDATPAKPISGEKARRVSAAMSKRSRRASSAPPTCITPKRPATTAMKYLRCCRSASDSVSWFGCATAMTGSLTPRKSVR